MGRVARYAHEEMGGSELDAVVILAYVAVNVGLGSVFCRSAAVMTSVSTLVTFVQKLSVIIAVEGGLALIIRALTQFMERLKKSIRTTLLLGVILAILLALQKVVDSVETLLERAGFIEELTGLVQLSCTQASRVFAELGDKRPKQFEVVEWQELALKSGERLGL